MSLFGKKNSTDDNDVTGKLNMSFHGSDQHNAQQVSGLIKQQQERKQANEKGINVEVDEGTDNKRTIYIGQKDIENIRNTLKASFPSVLVKAMTDQKQIETLTQIISTKKQFEPYPCFGRPEVARQIIQEVADLGVVDRLLQQNKDITDIGYNGRFLTIETPYKKWRYGLKDNERTEINENYIVNLVNRFASREGQSGKSFNHSNPIFNGFSNNIRISATYKSVSPVGTTMSLRISRSVLALNEINFEKFAPQFVYDLLSELILSHCNVIISGETGAGKTELQKLLIKNIPFKDRIIMIEDVAETHLSDLYPDKDIYSWTTDIDKSGNSEGIKLQDQVTNALRNNPKWIMVAETRGSESYVMLNSVLSGHSIITTMHSISNQAVPRRFIGMCATEYDIDEKMLEEDFLNYMHVGLHLSTKVINGKTYRYLDEISEFVPKTVDPTGVNPIFKQHIDQKGNRTWSTYPATTKLTDKVADEIDARLDYPIQKDVHEQVPEVTKLEQIKADTEKTAKQIARIKQAKKQQAN